MQSSKRMVRKSKRGNPPGRCDICNSRSEHNRNTPRRHLRRIVRGIDNMLHGSPGTDRRISLPAPFPGTCGETPRWHSMSKPATVRPDATVWGPMAPERAAQREGNSENIRMRQRTRISHAVDGPAGKAAPSAPSPPRTSNGMTTPATLCSFSAACRRSWHFDPHQKKPVMP